jgi:hypothetical protein
MFIGTASSIASISSFVSDTTNAPIFDSKFERLVVPVENIKNMLLLN